MSRLSFSKKAGIAALGVTILFIGLFAISPLFTTKHVSAQSAQNQITGWMWSDTIGWISVSGSGSGLTINSDGTITGWAWSDTIGWIKFGGLSGFPTGSGTQALNAQMNGLTMTGWVRACGGMDDIRPNQTDPNNSCTNAAGTRSDGWDGWIYLGSTGHGDGITFTSGSASGYAWGSDVVGWITPYNMSISCTSSSMCSSNGSQSIYTDTQCQTTSTFCSSGCNINTGLCQCSVSDSCSADGSQSIHTDNSCKRTFTNCPTGCNANTNLCNPPPTGNSASGCLSVNTVPPLCTKSARVRVGSKVPIYWNVNGVDNCTIAGNGDRLSSQLGQGRMTSSPINAGVIYTISCTGGNGTQFKDSVNINLIPSFKEI